MSQNVFWGDIVTDNLAIDVLFTNSPRDQLGILGPKIENQNSFGVRLEWVGCLYCCGHGHSFVRWMLLIVVSSLATDRVRLIISTVLRIQDYTSWATHFQRPIQGLLYSVLRDLCGLSFQ